jgi:formate hydrogenlyase subunit 6/NADH:ubiquinone oxidoreductase subunit I
MILPSRYYVEHGYIKGLIVLTKFLLIKLVRPVSNLFAKQSKLNVHQMNYLARGIRYYPSLKVNEDDSLKCISCKLCEQICPSNCISIKADENIKMHNTLKIGAVPKEFDIEIGKCTRCGYCEEVCPVDAIDLMGKYDFNQDPEKIIWNKEELKKAKKS